MFALLVAAALAQDCNSPDFINFTCDPAWEAWECEMYTKQHQEDLDDCAARAAEPVPATALPPYWSPLNTDTSMESLRDQASSAFDRPGPPAVVLEPGMTIEGNTLTMQGVEVSPPVPVNPPAPVEEPPPEDSPAPE